MGRINYRTGDIITFGSKNDFGYEDDEYDDYRYQVGIWHEELEYVIDDYAYEWFKVKLEYGYYDGISVVVDKNYCTIKEMLRDKLPSWFWLDDEDIKEIEEEVKDLRTELYRIAQIIPIKYPGWCTGYNEDEWEISKEIEEVLSNVLKEVKGIVEYGKTCREA